MIRDPSDGSVRQKTSKEITLQVNENGHTSIEIASKEITGLPPESIDPKRQARLELSREWLKTYHQKPEDISP